MVLEVAEIYIRVEEKAQFEIAIKRGIDEVISRAKGFVRCEIRHGIEAPERYLLMIEWQTLENHTVDFRTSPAFQAWRGLVGPFFATPPKVEHFRLLQ
ncbi:MAG: antibiotic biosynthesis monooxygenase [Pseudomonadota bacterium]